MTTKEDILELLKELREFRESMPRNEMSQDDISPMNGEKLKIPLPTKSVNVKKLKAWLKDLPDEMEVCFSKKGETTPFLSAFSNFDKKRPVFILAATGIDDLWHNKILKNKRNINKWLWYV